MRILFLSQWFQPEPMFKGLPLAKALAARGHDVEVLTGFPNYPGGNVYPGYKVRPWQREVLDGIPVVRVALYPSHDRSTVRRIANYLSFGMAASAFGPWLLRRPDVVYVYNLVSLALTARIFRALHGCPVVYDVQDLWPESVLSSGMLRGSAVSAVLERACRFAYGTGDRFVVLSPGFKKALADRGIARDLIDVVYNWTDESVAGVPPRDHELARSLGVDGSFNILFAGTMGVVQALDVVLEAAAHCMASLPAVRFVLVGGGVDVDRLRARSAESGLSNIVFVPRQPSSEMGKWFSLADAALVHLRDDPLFAITIPSKTQAYLAAGLPIIMGVPGDATDLVEAARAGVSCQSEDADDLVRAISMLADMGPERRRELGINGARYYGEHLCFRVGVDKLESVLRSLPTTLA